MRAPNNMATTAIKRRPALDPLPPTIRLPWLFRADDRHIDRWLSQYPGDSQLRYGHSFSRRQLLQALHDRQVALKALAFEERILAPPVIWCEGCLRHETSAKQSMRQWTVYKHINAVLLTIWEYISLDIAPEEAGGRL